MRTTLNSITVLVILTGLMFSACGGNSDSNVIISRYTVSYEANGADNGDVPADSTNYRQGSIVIVLDNNGNLARGGYAFAGWCETGDGTGASYTQGQTFIMGDEDVILYAKWTQNPSYTVNYDGNGNTGGDAPTDSSNYEEGTTVTVHANTGNLVSVQGGISFLFSGWNTESDGSGTSYTAGQTFDMGTEDVVLYAMWQVPYILPTSATDISLGAKGCLVDGDKLYVIEGTLFKVFDVSDPLNPLLLGTVTHGYTDLRVEPQAIHNNVVWCVRSSSGGMGAATYGYGVDVSDPQNPAIRGSLTLQSGSSLLSSTSLIYEGYWLVHDYSRNLIYVINISNPDVPVVYRQWSVPNMVNGGPGLMMMEGTLLYLACGENRTLKIYDLSDLSSVDEYSSVSTVDEAYGNPVKIGSYVYVIANPWPPGVTRLQIINVSNPAAPVNVGSVPISPGAIRGKNGRLFYFADSPPTVRAYSLADPLAPVVEASSTVAFSGPTTSLSITPMAWSSANWVGDYLVGMTWGSAAAYSGARALDFTVN